MIFRRNPEIHNSLFSEKNCKLFFKKNSNTNTQKEKNYFASK